MSLNIFLQVHHPAPTNSSNDDLDDINAPVDADDVNTYLVKVTQINYPMKSTPINPKKRKSGRAWPDDHCLEHPAIKRKRDRNDHNNVDGGDDILPLD